MLGSAGFRTGARAYYSEPRVTSFPFLEIARDFGAPYPDVIQATDVIDAFYLFARQEKGSLRRYDLVQREDELYQLRLNDDAGPFESRSLGAAIAAKEVQNAAS
jgi:hypothetical protein